jgi:hypothetical protein
MSCTLPLDMLEAWQKPIQGSTDLGVKVLFLPLDMLGGLAQANTRVT